MSERGPRAPRRPVTRTLHGVSWEDPYAWMKDPNWQRVMKDPGSLDPEIARHLVAENEHVERILSRTGMLRETLLAELKGRIKEDDSSVPTPDGEWSYFHRYRTGGQHPLFCRVPSDADDVDVEATGAGGDPDAAAADATVIIDGDAESAGHSYFRLVGYRHSPDHRLVAYGRDIQGSEFYEVRIREIESGRELGEVIPDASGQIVWSNDSRSFLYTKLDESHRPCRVHRHVLGTDPDDDALVYEESDPGYFVALGRTSSRRFAVIRVHTHGTSECHLVGADTLSERPRLVSPRTTDVEYDVDDDGERLVILTNADDAVDFKIVAAPPDDPGRARWTDVVPAVGGRLILDHFVFEEFYVRLEMRDALPRIVVTDRADGGEHEIAFDEPAYDLRIVPGHRYATSTLRYAYSSMTTPDETTDYDMRSRRRRLRKRREIPSGHVPDHYRTQRLFAVAADGARVPITVLHRRDTPLDGSAPCLLYAYGSYGNSTAADFRSSALPLVDRGFVYAIAHVRGGREMGHAWYTAGKLAHKPNTFSDFICAAEHLATAGYTTRGNISCYGGSAGGLLVGAVLNLAPDLFRAAVARVPFVDVLTTMCDDSLPLTPLEYPEWGDPVADVEAFETIRSYSPYDNVRPAAYPDLIVTAGLSDPRVTYWEPAKWVARLRETRTDDGHTLLFTHMSGGHGGASGRLVALEEVALVYAFVLMSHGMVER